MNLFQIWDIDINKCPRSWQPDPVRPELSEVRVLYNCDTIFKLSAVIQMTLKVTASASYSYP